MPSIFWPTGLSYDDQSWPGSGQLFKNWCCCQVFMTQDLNGPCCQRGLKYGLAAFHPGSSRWQLNLSTRRGFHPRKVDGVPGNTGQSYRTLRNDESKPAQLKREVDLRQSRASMSIKALQRQSRCEVRASSQQAGAETTLRSTTAAHGLPQSRVCP